MYRVVKTSEYPDDIRSAFEYPVFDVKKEPQVITEPQSIEEPEDSIDEQELNEEREEEERQWRHRMEEMTREAERRLEEAKQEAEQIKKDAYEEGFAEGQTAGYEAGFQAGETEGMSGYQKKISELEDVFAACILDVERLKDKTLEKYMDDLKEIALAIGEKIVRTSLRSNARVIERMILAATEKLKKSAWAKIYIGSTQDSGKDINADPKFLQELSNISDTVKVIIMDGEEPGTCIVERPDEIIDVSVGTQLENIREIMNNARI